MSPAPARTSLPAIVAAGRDLLEAGGLEAVTMAAVADRVGVRAPSLYKRIPSRAALVGAITEEALADLGRRLEPAGRDPDPASGLRAMATAFRAFAHEHPGSYALLFTTVPAGADPPVDRFALASAPLLSVAGRLAGPGRALEAARLVTAFAHGFVTMELAGAFRLGGDIDEAYHYGVEVLISALAGGGGVSAPVGLDPTLPSGQNARDGKRTDRPRTAGAW